jgi:AmiR/NasT family two-component response regulator
MSHRNTVTGVLVLLDRNELALDAERLSLIASMAKVAGSLLVQSRQLDRSQTLASQLQSALQSRVLIEQAKGVVAERTHSDMHTAFQILRQQARNEGRVLADVAKDIINQREAMMNTQKEMKSSYLNGGSL